MKVLLVDGEPSARATIRRFLDDLHDIEIAGEAADGHEALRLATTIPADVMFLDIEIPGPSGLEVAAALPTGMLAAFTSSHDELVARAFEINAVDYLLKPFTPRRLLGCVERLRMRLAAMARPSQVERQGLVPALHQLQPISDHWMVLDRGALCRLALADVECVKAADNYIELYTATEIWLDRTSLTAFLEHPATRGFVRVHRSFAVNREHIVRVAPIGKGDAEIVLSSGRDIRLSRRYRDKLLASDHVSRWLARATC